MPTGHQHGIIEGIIAALLIFFVKRYQLGKVLTGEIGIYTRRNLDTVRAADVAFISNERYTQVQSDSYLDIAPELVVEVLSPHDNWQTVQEKIEEYFSIGVKLIWIVNPKQNQIQLFRSPAEMRLLKADDMLSGEDVLPGFEVTVAEIFEEMEASRS